MNQEIRGLGVQRYYALMHCFIGYEHIHVEHVAISVFVHDNNTIRILLFGSFNIFHFSRLHHIKILRVQLSFSVYIQMVVEGFNMFNDDILGLREI